MDIAERIVPIETGARESRSGVNCRSCYGFIVGEINPPVFGEARMQGDIVQAPQTSIEYVRDSHDRLRIQLSLTHDPQPAGSLRDQYAAIRQEGKSVRARQTAHGNDAEFRAWNVAAGAAGPRAAAVKNQWAIQRRGIDHDCLLYPCCCARLKNSDPQSRHNKEDRRHSVGHRAPPRTSQSVRGWSI